MVCFVQMTEKPFLSCFAWEYELTVAFLHTGENDHNSLINYNPPTGENKDTIKQSKGSGIFQNVLKIWV